MATRWSECDPGGQIGASKFFKCLKSEYRICAQLEKCKSGALLGQVYQI